MSGILMQLKTFVNASPDQPEGNQLLSLWTAIILQAVKDIEEQLIYSLREQKTYKVAQIDRKYDIERTLYEVNSNWFKHICFEANIDHRRILDLINKTLDKYQFHNIHFDSGIVPKRIRQKKKYRHLVSK